MARNVGGVSCDLVHSEVSPLSEAVDVYRIPGVAGVGVQALAKGASSMIFVAIKFGTNSAVNTWRDSILALRNGLFDVEDDHGDTYTKLVMAEDPAVRKRGIRRPDQPSHTHRGEIVLRCVQARE